MTSAFSLAGLLRVRGVTADVSSAAAGAAARRLERTRHERATLEHRIAGAADAPIDAASLSAIAAARASTAELLAAVDGVASVQARELAERERERTDAHQALRAIQKLEDRHAIGERAARAADERATTDDLVAARAFAAAPSPNPGPAPTAVPSPEESR